MKEVVTMRSIMTSVAKFCTVFAGLSLIVFIVSVSAEDKGNRPCADDITKFCKDVKPGGGRIIACLNEHQKDLSASCKDKIAEYRKNSQNSMNGTNMKKVCQGDVTQFCKDVKPGGGRIIECLKEHSAELSRECKESLQHGKK